MNTRLRLRLLLVGGAALLLLVGGIVIAGILRKAKPIPAEKIVAAELGDIHGVRMALARLRTRELPGACVWRTYPPGPSGANG